MAWDTKDPNEVLDFLLNWAPLVGTSDSISDVDWILPEGIEEHPTKPRINTATTTTVWLIGGTAGETYPILCRVTTAVGRVYDHTETLLVDDL